MNVQYVQVYVYGIKRGGQLIKMLYGLLFAVIIIRYLKIFFLKIFNIVQLSYVYLKIYTLVVAFYTVFQSISDFCEVDLL